MSYCIFIFIYYWYRLKLDNGDDDDSIETKIIPPDNTKGKLLAGPFPQSSHNPAGLPVPLINYPNQYKI